MLENVFKTWSAYLALGTEAAASVVIAIAVVQAVWLTIGLYRSRATSLATERVRLPLGRWLTLSLEFLLAADILRTAVAPTWNDIGQLGAIVIIRTALNYFLHSEIARAQRADDQLPPSPGS